MENSTLRNILRNLRFSDEVVAKRLSREYRFLMGLDVYSISANDMRLCIVTDSTVKPASIAIMDNDQILNHVAVFKRGPVAWQKVWPHYNLGCQFQIDMLAKEKPLNLILNELVR